MEKILDKVNKGEKENRSILTGKKDSCLTNECELERCRIILDDDLKELPFTQEAKEIIQWSRNERNYNELELMLIELTGSKKNMYKWSFRFRMMYEHRYEGKIIRLGNDWILIKGDVDDKRMLQVKNIISIS